VHLRTGFGFAMLGLPDMSVGFGERNHANIGNAKDLELILMASVPSRASRAKFTAPMTAPLSANGFQLVRCGMAASAATHRGGGKGARHATSKTKATANNVGPKKRPRKP